MRGNILNRTLACYYNRTSDIYVANQTHIQIVAFAMSVSMLALSRLRLAEKMSKTLPIAITGLTIACMWITNISVGLFHKRLHNHISGTFVDQRQLFNTLGDNLIFSYRTISFVNNFSLVLISMVYYIIAISAEGLFWLPVALVFGSAYRFIRIDSDSIQLKQRLLEVLHECR